MTKKERPCANNVRSRLRAGHRLASEMGTEPDVGSRAPNKLPLVARSYANERPGLAGSSTSALAKVDPKSGRAAIDPGCVKTPLMLRSSDRFGGRDGTLRSRRGPQPTEPVPGLR